jgi:hypothetical protein
MIATKRPLVGARREKALAWFFEAAAAQGRAVYLKGVFAHGEVPSVIAAIERDDFSALAVEGFDETVATNDRPFAFIGVTDAPEVPRLLRISALICGALLLLFAAGAFRRAPPGRIALLCGFNVLIGFGYFFIEIMLIQIYQNIFISTSWSLILVLGFLLLSSGIGGHFSERLKAWKSTVLLIPVSIAAIYLPWLILISGMWAFLGKALSIVLICATGFLLGVYFPQGLVLAKKWEIGHKVPHLFALNSIAGSFAVILALYSGIKIGYQATLIFSILFYCIAGLMISGRKESISG